MNVDVKIEDDKITVEFDKVVNNIQTNSIWIYGVKKVVIETLDVVLECYDKSNKLIGSIFYRIDGKISVWAEHYDDGDTIYLIEDGRISEDVFNWNACND